MSYSLIVAVTSDCF